MSTRPRHYVAISKSALCQCQCRKHRQYRRLVCRGTRLRGRENDVRNRLFRDERFLGRTWSSAPLDHETLRSKAPTAKCKLHSRVTTVDVSNRSGSGTCERGSNDSLRHHTQSPYLEHVFLHRLVGRVPNFYCHADSDANPPLRPEHNPASICDLSPARDNHVSQFCSFS